MANREVFPTDRTLELIELVRPLTLGSRLRDTIQLLPETALERTGSFSQSRLCYDTETDQQWAVAGKDYQAWGCYTLRGEPVEPNPQATVYLRARNHIDTVGSMPVYDEYGELQLSSIDYFHTPENLAWRKTGHATIDLILRGALHEEPVAKIDTNNVTATKAELFLLSLARGLTDLSYLGLTSPTTEPRNIKPAPMLRKYNPKTR